jgi:hypothetical protein
MLLNFSSKFVRSTLLSSYRFSTISEGADFLQMVEQYFDNAGRFTDIRADQLNFYKKADNVVKFNLTLVRGTTILTFR